MDSTRKIVVEFNETSDEENIPNFQGRELTPELLEKIEGVDEHLHIFSSGGYFKFYFDEYENEQLVAHLRIDIGDGLERNKEKYAMLEDFLRWNKPELKTEEMAAEPTEFENTQEELKQAQERIQLLEQQLEVANEALETLGGYYANDFTAREETLMSIAQEAYEQVDELGEEENFPSDLELLERQSSYAKPVEIPLTLRTGAKQPGFLDMEDDSYNALPYQLIYDYMKSQGVSPYRGKNEDDDDLLFGNYKILLEDFIMENFEAADNQKASRLTLMLPELGRYVFKVEIPEREKEIIVSEEAEVKDNSHLSQAKRKLERLENERDERLDKLYSHQALTNGQPMNDKRNGAAWFKKHEQLENAISDKISEVGKQRERVEMLEEKEWRKNTGLNRQGTGLAISVENIPRIEEEIEKAARGESLYTKATISRYKKELENLKAIQNQSEKASSHLSPRAKSLIESGDLTQWKKKPTIYFVKGLRKVALELNENGDFEVSQKYFPKTEEEKKRVSELLSRKKVAKDAESIQPKSLTVENLTETEIQKLIEIVNSHSVSEIKDCVREVIKFARDMPLLEGFDFIKPKYIDELERFALRGKAGIIEYLNDHLKWSGQELVASADLQEILKEKLFEVENPRSPGHKFSVIDLFVKEWNKEKYFPKSFDQFLFDNYRHDRKFSGNYNEWVLKICDPNPTIGASAEISQEKGISR